MEQRSQELHLVVGPRAPIGADFTGDFNQDVRELNLPVGPEPFASEELSGNHQHLPRLGGDDRAVALGPTHDAGDASTLAQGVFTLEDGKLSPDEHPWEGGSSE